ncbi:MAG TPA: hypothetical protein VG982_02975 [Candidatus Paceibacterota bacterium]|nr:hypothetical protein [Candidatus Paceibacterota bacterium]
MENNNSNPNGTPSNVPNPTSSKKNLIISGAIVLVVLILLVVVPHLRKGGDTKTTSDQMTDKTESTTDSTTASSASPLSRADALAAYADKMIQANDNCQMTPTKQAQLKGTTIMVDNNTDTPHKITIGPKTYTVGAHHYTLSWLNLDPGTLMVTCDGTDTGATIVVQ